MLEDGGGWGGEGLRYRRGRGEGGALARREERVGLYPSRDITFHKLAFAMSGAFQRPTPLPSLRGLFPVLAIHVEKGVKDWRGWRVNYRRQAGNAAPKGRQGEETGSGRRRGGRR